MSLILYEFLMLPDEENWLLPMQVFFKLSLEGWLYILVLILVSYIAVKKIRANHVFSFIPFIALGSD